MLKKSLLFVLLLAFAALSALAQLPAPTAQITGMVKDPNQAILVGTQVVLTNSQTKAKISAVTDGRGIYTFSALQPGNYVIEIDANGFARSVSAEINLVAGQTVKSDFALALAANAEVVNVSAGTVENAYRVDTVKPGSPLGTVPILDLPYSVNVISRQLIDDTQSRNFKEASKYLPLISFQEMQGPEVLRPETRGMQGSNMQNDRKDGMGIAVTTPSALEEYEQIEVVNGLGGPIYGPANPSGMFNFVTKRPTNEQYREVELGYEGDTVGTIHTDLGGRIGPNHFFGYRTNLVLADGNGYVNDSQLRRQLAAVALDVHPFAHTVVQGNFSYYNLFQHGYPGWFAYTPVLTPSAKAPYTILPVNAPDPTRQGYGQSFAGVDLNNQISEVRVKQDFSRNWQLVVGVLNQLADRNINTPVNSLVNTNASGSAAGYLANSGNYLSYLANGFSPLAPRFQVKSDLAYMTGKFKTWGISHEVVIGSTGYRFASWSPATSPTKAQAQMCAPGVSAKSCLTDFINISDPLVLLPPAAGIPSYGGDNPLTHGIYVSSIIHQQGFNVGDTVTLTPRWLVRVAASQDWIWTNNYTTTGAPNYAFNPNTFLNYSTQGVSPTASLIFKPRANMTVYGTFADSLQAPDTPVVSTPATATCTASTTTCVINSGQALAPYRSTEGEIGYKLVLRKINFSTALFRVERPFANTVQGVVNPDCLTLSGTVNCEEYKIVGNQINYGIETMLSGRVFERLMVMGGLTALNPKLTDTGIAATNNRDFVGIPAYKSNILAEYHIPVLLGAFFNFDWEHVGRRPVDDINSTYTPQYNTFDLGFRYTAKVFNKVATWRVTANNVSNVHYWSTLGPGSITGQSTGSYLGHLGEPLLITASMKYDF